MTIDQAQKSPSWTLLKGLAQHDTDASARMLGVVLRQREDARAQLRLLEDYRADYRARLDSATRNGIGGEGLRNFRMFIGNLEAAIAQQTDVLATLQRQLAAATAAWEKQKRRVGSYEVLDERQVVMARRGDDRREQIQQDEMANRIHLKRALGAD